MLLLRRLVQGLLASHHSEKVAQQEAPRYDAESSWFAHPPRAWSHQQPACHDDRLRCPLRREASPCAHKIATVANTFWSSVVHTLLLHVVPDQVTDACQSAGVLKSR